MDNIECIIPITYTFDHNDIWSLYIYILPFSTLPHLYNTTEPRVLALTL